MTEVALPASSVLGRTERTETSLTLPLDFSYDEFEELLALLGTVENACIWWSSDALIQGEHLYGEEVAQAAERLNRSPQTVLNRTSVARRVPPSRRNPSLSFTAHAEVAALEPADQIRWLDTAASERLAVHELRERIRAERDGTPDITTPERICRCCGRAYE